MGYSLLTNEVYWGYNPLILTFDPNFLGYPSNPWKSLAIHFVKVGLGASGFFPSKVYQHPKKEPPFFKMVVDFQGYIKKS